MRLAKDAVSYYCQVTGNEWNEFFNKVDDAVSVPIETQTGELWLIHALMNEIVKSGMSVNEFKVNKDAIKAEFDNEGRKLAGEFFTPIIWAEELHKYMDKYIPNWRTDYNVWEGSCYDISTKVIIRRHYDSWDDALKNANLKLSGDLICLGDKYSLDKEEARKFNHLDWLYDDGYTLIGRFNAHDLLPDDEILTCNPDNPYKPFIWCGYHDLFFKTSNEMISFRFGDEVFDFETRLKVTPDHKMFIYMMGGSLMSVTADELCKMLDSGKEVFIWGRDKHYYKVNEYRRWNIEREVWDLTTNNDTHCFCVSVGVGSSKDIYTDIFSGNCGSGNLIRTAKITPEHLFASSLQDDDITLIKNTPELKDCHAFQLDFLSACDDGFNNLFLEKLPEDLQRVIKNNEPLIFLMNPPYKTGQAKATEVGRFMNDKNGLAVFENTDFSKPSYDLFYQFCFQVMNLVAQFNLTNVYYCVFGPLTWFTGAGANILLNKFEHCFEFIDGMCISAQEFSDTSTSILWGIGATIWKSRGGYISGKDEDFHKDIFLDKKYLTPDGGVGCEGKVLYEPPREKLSTWVAPNDVDFYHDEPLMTSHLTFKGSDVNVKVANYSAKLANNALGTLMVGNTLTRSADQSAILSMPSTIQYVSITEENFWRCVGSYVFRRVIDAGWAIAKKEISAPNTNVEGYDLWLKNGLVLFLFEYKSMMSSLRNVEWNGEKRTIRNNLFFLTEEEVRANCTDEVILKDLEQNPPTNQFMLKMIAECEPYWVPEVRALYDWCKTYTLATYDSRKTVNYSGSLECWDAGFQQLRNGLWDSEHLDEDLTKLLVQARDYLRKDLDKFGFVSEVEGDL